MGLNDRQDDPEEREVGRAPLHPKWGLFFLGETVCPGKELLHPRGDRMRKEARVSSKDRKLVLTQLGSSTAWGAHLFKLFPSLTPPTPGCNPPHSAPPQHHLAPTSNCLPQQDTKSGELGLGVVEGRPEQQGASGVPTEGAHRAPGGTRGAAGQLAPGGNGHRDYKGQLERWHKVVRVQETIPPKGPSPAQYASHRPILDAVPQGTTYFVLRQGLFLTGLGLAD